MTSAFKLIFSDFYMDHLVRRRLTFRARRDQTSSLRLGAARGGGGGGGADGKVSIESLCLSLSSCQKNFNSKVIKFRT